jgi:hypothetical protein
MWTLVKLFYFSVLFWLWFFFSSSCETRANADAFSFQFLFFSAQFVTTREHERLLSDDESAQCVGFCSICFAGN